jgi:hypothetical protein
MTEIFDVLGRLPIAVRVALGAVFALQLGLQIYGLVDLSRRDWVAGGRKWPWLLVIVFGQLLGALVYLAVGRSTPPSAEPDGRAGPGGPPAREAIDSLYRDRREP